MSDTTTGPTTGAAAPRVGAMPPGSGVPETATGPAPAIDALAAGSLAHRLGIRMLEAAPGRAVGTMPVEGNTQPQGLLHGGASVVLAETLGSYAAALHAGPHRIAVGIEVNATHHRGARDGVVTGVATAIQLGGRMASYAIEITDEQGKRVCTARLTCLVLDAPPGNRGGGV